MNPERRSIFALPAGPRAKWVVFLVWLVGIFIAAGPREPARQVHRRREQRVDLVPAGRRGVHQGTRGHRGPAERRAGAGGDRLPARVRPDAGRPAEDRRGRPAHDRGALPGRGAGWGEGGRGRSGGRRRAPRRSARQPHGCGGPTTPIPGQPADYAPFVGPICSRGRQGGDRDRLPEGRRRGRQDPRPDRRLARHRVRPGRRSRGEDHRRRGLRGRRDQGLREHQRHAAAGRAHAGDRAADPHLPLADLPVHPAGGRHLRGDPVPLDRLRHLRAGRHDQRAVELDHVDPRARRRHGLRAPGRGEIPGGAAPHRGSPRGHAGGDGLRRPGGVRLGRHRDRGPPSASRSRR